ncbi:SRPBCC family protein [Streptomyces brasiliensis]|uniref:Carbon monoxide dehydrogenase subunit G n=1 Tax=Streptomyces brasiliensis TaxID=1954 RepID=A0A917L8I8_9ACTN|nr:SRPBCC domain-containing protein [Streptomyces brasiliensis]GGJ49814.1 hypothetical protein GCM10010121_071150 [Streptomyces brasiliensis]
MEHEVFVPVPAERLREALADPARVARAVPGLQQDAGAEPIAGRLKVRVGSHSVTYRGAVRLARRDDGTYAIEGDATEARGTGTVKLALTLRLHPTETGTTIRIDGTATADGRLSELPQDSVLASTTRLLNRFVEGLAQTPGADAEPGAGPTGETAEQDAREDVPAAADGEDAAQGPPAPEDESGTGGAGGSRNGGDGEAESPAYDNEPPAEAAHARRTMIGRSAEEVDHAPPRGRYAPVPAPQTVAAASTLRWAAPAAALVVASVIIVGRALRKRR